MLKIGSKAPDFTLPISMTESITLSQYLGQPVILTFYPADFSPVCGDQMSLYNNILPMFAKYNAQLLGISVDGIFCHMAFSKSSNLHFPLLSDFNPKGKVSRLYESYDENNGFSERGLYVIDASGKIAWNYMSPTDINPGADGILDALSKL